MKRYKWDREMMLEHEDGNWVRFDDIAPLIEAAIKRVDEGHGDLCPLCYSSSEKLECSCGHDGLKKSLEDLEK